MATKTNLGNFAFTIWVPNTKKVQASQKPNDMVAPLPDKLRFVAVKDRCSDLSTRRGKYITKLANKSQEKNKFNKTTLSEMPTLKKIALGDLEIVIDVQRPVDENHVIDIIINWDSRHFGTPKGAYDPVRKRYCITEGQHRILALRERIKMGLHNDEVAPEDWEKFEIWVEVITLDQHQGSTDYSICREVFLGENGGYKLPITEIDLFKNEVAGKLIDSPNKMTKEEYERAAKRYQILLNNGSIPVHTKDKANSVKSGAFPHVRYLRDKSLTDDEVEQIAKHHNTYWKHEPWAAAEVLPIRNLFRMIESNPYFNSKDKQKVKERDDFLLACNATVQAVAGDWSNFQELTQETWGVLCTDVRQTEDKIPDDLSLTFLLQLVQRAGYAYPGIKKDWYKKYEYEKTTMFDCLSTTKKALFP
jgi:hypothetical protein